MITIHYRPLAFRRAYESVKLPLPDARRAVRQAAYLAATNDEIAEAGGHVQVTYGRRGGKTAAGEAWANEHGATVIVRPDPLGDAVARGGLDAVRAAQEIAAKRLGITSRAPTTREIPIAVDATLPAIAAALERLRTELAAMGLAHQAARVRAIGLAVETVNGSVRSIMDDVTDADAWRDLAPIVGRDV